MDALRAEPDSLPAGPSARLADLIRRAQENEQVFLYATWACAGLVVAMVLFSASVLIRDAQPGTLLSPTLIALLLVANLLPAIALMVLLSRRIANARAERRGLGTGRLHTRLVALFSVIAAVPTVLVAIFASILIQSGLEFWFSDRARGMLENTVQLAQSTYVNEVKRVDNEAVAMSGDISGYLKQLPIDSPRFAEGLGYQTYSRSLNEAAVVAISPQGQVQTLAVVNPYDGMVDPSKIAPALALMRDRHIGEVRAPGRIAVLVPLSAGSGTYLFVARKVDADFKAQIDRAGGVLTDYRDLLSRSRANQLKFNFALLIGALVIVGLAIFIAMRSANWSMPRGGSRRATSPPACRSRPRPTRLRRWRRRSTA